MQMMVFTTAGVRYAIALDVVQEVVRAVAITPLPEAPAVISGVINLRGTGVPVFDLRLRFGAPARKLDPSERFVVSRTVKRMVALRVDSVDWIREVPESDVQEMKEITSDSPYVAGVATIADDLLYIHDVDTFLSAAESSDLERSLAELNSGQEA